MIWVCTVCLGLNFERFIFLDCLVALSWQDGPDLCPKKMRSADDKSPLVNKEFRISLVRSEGVETCIIRAVEIPCPTCPNWSNFIQDKLKISTYLSLDRYKCIKLIQFYISYFD